MSNSVTIYFCGTNFHRGSNDAVSKTWQATTGRNFIFDGPGSPLKGHQTENDPHILKAEDIYKNLEKNKNVVFENRAHLTKINYEGTFQGKGTQDNILVALNWLWLEYYKQQFTSINLVGWSRGAVTCIMLSHSIKEAGFNSVVNIFAFDPVPGDMKNDFSSVGKSFDSTGRIGSYEELPDIVNEYISVLMENEIKPGFSCISPKGGRIKKEYPLPGSHSDCVKFEKDNPVGIISTSLCHDFLKRNGTQLQKYHILNDDQLIIEYNKLVDKGLKPSILRKNIVQNNFRGTKYINFHHQELANKVSIPAMPGQLRPAPLIPPPVSYEDWLSKTGRFGHSRSNDLRAVDNALSQYWKVKNKLAKDTLIKVFWKWYISNPKERDIRNVDNCVELLRKFLFP